MIASFVAIDVSPAPALVSMPNTFLSLAKAGALNNPGIVIMDPANGELIYSKNGDVEKAPASVMKLFSTTDAIRTLGANKQFDTTIYSTSKSNKVVIIGGQDPWLTTSALEAKKYQRAFLPYLINKAIQKNPHIKAISLEYKDLYVQDIFALQRYFRGRVKIYPHQHSSTDELRAMTTESLGTISSPKVSDIVQFTLLWSDNLLAARLEQMSARAKGFTTDSAGIQQSITSMLASMEIPTTGLVFKDGAGLSHENRVNASTIAKLLKVIHSTPELEVIYNGLPVAGESGTLKNRFVKDAPTAVGLIHAKTGWINTSVSLAGFVQTREKQYIFAIIASGLRSRESNRASARIAIDKLLATIAKPQVITEPVSVESTPELTPTN
jgi:D-alanyl-D-alanine carboxypeptidase